MPASKTGEKAIKTRVSCHEYLWREGEGMSMSDQSQTIPKGDSHSNSALAKLVD
jgi:hypothetical protein